jgi:hypothetical protein
MNDNLTAYKTQLLGTKITKNEIREQCKGGDSTEYELDLKNRAENMDSSWRYTRQLNPIDSAIYARKQSHIDNENEEFNLPSDDYSVRFDFDSTRDITGLALGINTKASSLTMTYQLDCVGIMTDMSIVSGISLGSQVHFWVSKKELDSLLDRNDLNFLESIATQRMMLGDFMPLEVTIEEKHTLYNVSEIIRGGRFDTDKHLTILNRDIAYLSVYNATVFQDLIEYLMDNKLDKDSYLFKDSLLKTSYKKIARELMYEYQFEDTNSIYDLYDQDYIGSLGCYGYFVPTGLNFPKISRSNDEVIIHFEETVNKVMRRKNVKEVYDIYLTYSSIRHLLKPHDQIILEALMAQIAK